MSRMRQIRKFLVLIVIGVLLVATKTPYQLVGPGSAEDMSRFVTVKDSDEDDKGSFFLVTATQMVASPLLFVYGLLNPNTDLLPRQQVVPPDMDIKEYNEFLLRWMEETQELAKVVALRRLGYEVPIESDGVSVVEIGKDSPARGILQPGDVILAVDGQRVFLADELVSSVQLRPVGDPVTLVIQRAGEEKEVTIPTAGHIEAPEKAAIRVTIRTLNWQPVLPVEIAIDTGEIIGPSAGMMFVLEILNQLDSRDLTAGRLIAGTGTINLKEEIGAIGSVRQKIVAAERAGAEYFLVPQENYNEAKASARKIVAVPVSTLSQALEFLSDLHKIN
ncbi:MAG: PDZ domain-containing protein [Dethiobacter sp.]|nr:PDZ domain-containing protein [Dethiobacter sp.]